MFRRGIQARQELSISASQLKLRVAETAPGSKAPVIVSRNGEDKTFDVTVGTAPENKVAKANETNGTGRKEALAGVGVTDLDQNTRSELNVPGDLQGAVIISRR
jgi:hypothetical protein